MFLLLYNIVSNIGIFYDNVFMFRKDIININDS